MAGTRLHPRLAALPVERVLGIEVPVARERRARLLGLAGIARERAGSGLLLPGCSSVHGLGMRFALDVVFLDAAGRPICSLPLAPGRVVWRRGASAVLELPAPLGRRRPG